MDKRYIIIGAGVLLIIVLLILVLTMGGKSKSKTAVGSKLIVWDSVDNQSDFTQAIQDFTNNHPGLDISFVKKDPATYETDSINAIASGNGPDVWIIPSNWMPSQLDKLAAMPAKTLDPKGKKDNASYFQDTFVPVTTTDSIANGQVYGVPLNMDTLSLYYNADTLGNCYQTYIQAHPSADAQTLNKLLNNPPATWDDITNIVKYCGANMIALGTSQVEQASDILTAMMMQDGAQMNADDFSAALFHTSTNLFGGAPYPGAQALTFFTSFAKSGDPHNTWSPNEKSAYDDFVQGKVAMMINYSQIFTQLTKDLGNQPNVTGLPQITKTSHPVDVANYQIMTVPKSSQNATLAWNFIKATTADASFLGQYLSQKHLENPYQSKNQDSSDYNQAQAAEAQSWHNPDPVKVQSIFNNAIDQNLSGQNSQTVVESAAAQVTTLLAALKGS
ncbi:MAG: extracellular solute-binding protein [Patescibacteria group bacterium]|jgi:ABC-type glycerol-3-phosphate transport system substrate-binding protein